MAGRIHSVTCAGDRGFAIASAVRMVGVNTLML